MIEIMNRREVVSNLDESEDDIYMALTNYTMMDIFNMLIAPAFIDTIKMTFISGILSVIFGFLVGVLLVVTEKDNLCPMPILIEY